MPVDAEVPHPARSLTPQPVSGSAATRGRLGFSITSTRSWRTLHEHNTLLSSNPSQIPPCDVALHSGGTATCRTAETRRPRHQRLSKTRHDCHRPTSFEGVLQLSSAASYHLPARVLLHIGRPDFLSGATPMLLSPTASILKAHSLKVSPRLRLVPRSTRGRVDDLKSSRPQQV